ncbi:MAG: hypothetical protein ACK5K7_02795 [Bacilli bacterium]
MKLIECRNQEQIINALLIRENNDFEIVNKNDINSIIFLIEQNEKFIGELTISCEKTSIEITHIIFNQNTTEDLQIKALKALEEFGIKMNFENIIHKCEMEETYTFKKLNYQSYGNIFIENDILYIKMIKKIK